MPSFDIVSEINMSEVRNSTENADREVASRWDFRNVLAEFQFNEKNETITVSSESDFQLDQLLDILRSKLIKRGIDNRVLDIPSEFSHSGKTYSVLIKLKQGIDKEIGKKIVKFIKETKLKVQVQVQSEQVRVTGKSRDELQSVMSLIKTTDFGQPLQFTNFRD